MKFQDGTPNPLARDGLHPHVPTQAGNLRQRIIRESREYAKNQASRSRTRTFKAPRIRGNPIPGTSAFDLWSLEKLPDYGQKSAATTPLRDSTPSFGSHLSESLDDAASWTSEEHHEHMMLEFDNLFEKSRSSSPNDLTFSTSEPYTSISGCSSCLKEQHCYCSQLVTGNTQSTAIYRPNTEFPTASSAQPAHSIDDLNLQKPLSLDTNLNVDLGEPAYTAVSEILPEVPLLKVPATRPISEQQLINEVKGIYAGLVMVEKKCIEIVNQQSQSTNRLESQQWEALIALHRTLLQEHHDFFFASQHPKASDGLKHLAVKYAMPERMWRYGMSSVLEFLRHDTYPSNPASKEFVDFIFANVEILASDLPQFTAEWDIVRYNLREYFLSLRTYGIDVLAPNINDWANHYSPTTLLVREIVPPMTGSFFGDDEEFIAWHCSQSARKSRSLEEQSIPRSSDTFLFSDTALRFMSGWLYLGRKIATSFQSFASTFLIIGLLGSQSLYG